MLLDAGFDRIQLSVYAKYYQNFTSASRDIRMIKGSIPPGGMVRIVNITDRQWSATLRFESAVPVPIEAKTEQLTIF